MDTGLIIPRRNRLAVDFLAKNPCDSGALDALNFIQAVNQFGRDLHRSSRPQFFQALAGELNELRALVEAGEVYEPLQRLAGVYAKLLHSHRVCMAQFDRLYRVAMERVEDEFGPQPLLIQLLADMPKLFGGPCTAVGEQLEQRIAEFRALMGVGDLIGRWDRLSYDCWTLITELSDKSVAVQVHCDEQFRALMEPLWMQSVGIR